MGKKKMELEPQEQTIEAKNVKDEIKADSFEEKVSEKEDFSKAEPVKEEAAKADSTKDEEPVIDFEKTEEYPDEYEEKGKEVKELFLNKLQIKLLEFVLGICFMILTTKTGFLGTFLFIVGLFYLIPDGLVKSISYFYRYKHYENYIESRDYKINESYWTIVMNKMKEKGIFKK